MGVITNLEELRALYKAPSERAIEKELSELDRHCRRFIELSRFLVVTTRDNEGRVDASPRGGDAGFVKVTPEGKLLLPDWPGNNRLDTYSNLLETGAVGLLFFVPGVDEVLRIKGVGEIRVDEALRGLCGERTTAQACDPCRGAYRVPALRKGADAFKALVARGSSRPRGLADHGSDVERPHRYPRSGGDPEGDGGALRAGTL